MKRASITEAKNGLSALVDQVRRGQTVVIEDRGVPVARLEPLIASGGSTFDGRLARLMREGVLRPAIAAPPRRVLAANPPVPNGRVSLSQALIDERRSGR